MSVEGQSLAMLINLNFITGLPDQIRDCLKKKEDFAWESGLIFIRVLEHPLGVDRSLAFATFRLRHFIPTLKTKEPRSGSAPQWF